MESLKNKNVLITGASSGIGEACARAFADEGANLIICARRIERLESLRNEFPDSEILVLQMDVTLLDDVNAKIESIPDKFLPLDILVNNAGLSRGLTNIQEGDIADWEEMIDTNIKGLLYVTRKIIPVMVERDSGHIINIGSIAGHEVYPMGNVYAATKHAVFALSKGMKMDVLGSKVRVSSVDPGLVETEFSLVRFRGDQEKAGAVYEGIDPLTPEDIAETVIFCATRSPHVNISNVIMLSTDQAAAIMVHRKA